MPNRREMEIVNVKVSAAEGKDDSTEIPINSVQAEINTVQEEIDSTKKQIVSVQEEINSTKKQIDSIEAKIALTEARMTTGNLKERKILQTSLESLDKEKIWLLENLKFLREENKYLEANAD